jgi:hypothetical protein
VTRNERWPDCVPHFSAEVIILVLSNLALRLGSLYQLLSVVFIRVIFLSSFYEGSILIYLLTRRLPTRTTLTDPSVGSIVVYLLGIFDSSAIFAVDWYQHVDLVQCKN